MLIIYHIKYYVKLELQKSNPKLSPIKTSAYLMFLTNFTFTSQITPRKQPKDKFTLFGQASHKPLKTHKYTTFITQKS